MLSSKANGHSPKDVTTDPKTRMIDIYSKLPALPTLKATIEELSHDTLYYLMIVPYTYNGKNESTYNYLTNGAPSVTKSPLNCNIPSNAFICESATLPASGVIIAPNPSSYQFTLKIDKAFTNNKIDLHVSDALGRIYYHTVITGKQEYRFGETLKPGVYFVYIDADLIKYQFKIIKE